MSRSCRPPAARAAVRQAHGGVLSASRGAAVRPRGEGSTSKRGVLSPSKGAAVFLLCAGAYAAETQVLEDSWAKILMAGSHIGWGHTVAERVGDIVKISAEQYFRVGRWDAPTEARVTTTHVETHSGRPISFTQELKMSEHPEKLVGRIEGRKLILSRTVMGETRRVELDWQEGAVLTWGLELRIRRLLNSGGSTTAGTYSTDVSRFVEAKVEHLGREEVNLSGESRRLHKLKITGLMPGKTIYEYRDDSGATWKRSTDLLRMPVEFVRCGEKEARAIAGINLDVGVKSMIRSNVRFMQPRRVEEAVYELDLAEAGAKLDFAGQEVVEQKDKTVVLRVKTHMPAEGAALPMRKQGMEKYLADTSIVQAGHPYIKELAREAAGEEKNALRAAVALERWAHRNVRFKGFGVGFASALEVARNRSGDCSEHAVLFCALARALGIPSRAAAGIIYWEARGSKAEFGYHLWTEVHVGEWVALDATLGVGRSDATHIKLAETAFEEVRGMGEVAEGLLKALDGIGLKVKSYRVAGMRVVPGEAQTEWSIQGRRYTDARYCLSLDVPKGWRVFLRGTWMLKDSDAALELAPRDGSCRITVTSTRNPPGGRLRDVLKRLRREASVKEVSRWMIDGEEAATARFAKVGEEREAVMVVDDDVRHVIRLSPWSPEGSRALKEVARSFRFVGKARR